MPTGVPLLLCRFYGDCGTAHAIAVDASSVHVCWQMASNSQYALPPQSSPQKSASGKSQLRSKQTSKGPSPENFLTIGDCFERYTYRVTGDARLVKEKRSHNSEAARCTFRSKDLFPVDDIALIHWLKPPSWNRAPATLPRAHNKITRFCIAGMLDKCMCCLCCTHEQMIVNIQIFCLSH